MESEMQCSVSQMWRPKMPEGMDLEISHHPLTMRRVVNLIIAMEKWKGSTAESVLSTEFRDENLLNIMLENLVEEQIVFERGTTPSEPFVWTGEDLYNVTDSEKRSLVLLRNSMELHAVMLQGGSACRKVQFSMSTYVPSAPSQEARTVALCIRGTDLYLSCHKDGDESCTLHLEAVDNKESLKSITPGSDMERFLFNQQVTGLNISTLTSVPFSDWYVSTAAVEKKPLEMCQETAQRHRTFTLEQTTLTLDCETASQV
ncbi:interleukin-1 beta-like [Pempheris klunzingeri]|uniref:interleukin-1 beta-like n=1 Tax=Pempheris klunzingeri TaxID=3127111 RepID=UPI0039813D85